MLKENWRFISRLERVGDLVIVVVAFFLAYFGREALVYWDRRFDWNLPFGGLELAPVSDYLVILLLSLVVYLVSLQLLGAYSSMRLRTPLQLLGVFAAVSLLVFVLVAASLFTLKIDLSRSFVGLFCLLTMLLLSVERYLILAWLRYWRRRGLNYRSVVICGLGRQALKLTGELLQRPELGLRVRCFADLHQREEIEEEYIAYFKDEVHKLGCRTVGRIIYGVAALEAALQEYAIDEVIFCEAVECLPLVEETVNICAEQGVRTTLVADFFSVGLVRSGISYFGDLPLIHYQTPPGDRWDLALKRLMDVMVAALLLVVLAPLFAVIAVLILLSSGRPVFFVQTRVGRNGHLFKLYKFRSMLLGAEKEKAALSAHNEMQGPAFKMSNDPRVTRVGRFLRRYSLDELPQLWNVLIGDMSLVGPRPPVPGEVNEYARYYRRRLSMRPGITCTWQVSGRSEIKDFENWVKLDLDYIDNWSLGGDIRLLLRTVPAVLLGTGAR